MDKGESENPHREKHRRFSPGSIVHNSRFLHVLRMHENQSILKSSVDVLVIKLNDILSDAQIMLDDIEDHARTGRK